MKDIAAALKGELKWEERPWGVWLEGKWVRGKKGRERKERRNCSRETECPLYRNCRENQNEERIWRQKGKIHSGILRKRCMYLMCNFYGMQKSLKFDGSMIFFSLSLSLSVTHTHTHTQYAAAKEEEQRKLALSKIRRFKLRLRRIYNHAFTQVRTQYGRTHTRTRAHTHTNTPWILLFFSQCGIAILLVVNFIISAYDTETGYTEGTSIWFHDPLYIYTIQ